MSCRENVCLGAYVLGALEPAERASVERHLSGCRSCRKEVVDFAPLPGLLRHTPFEELPEVRGSLGSPAAAVAFEPLAGEVPEIPDTPFEAFGPRRMALVPREDTARRAPAWRPGGDAAPDRVGGGGPGTGPRSSRRRWIVAVTAVLMAACASALFACLGPGSRQPGAGPRTTAATTLSATDPDTRISASAALTPKTWGTQVELKLRGMPENVRCLIVIHDRAGHTEIGGSWASGHHGTSTVPASTSVNEPDISRIDIVSHDGDLLVSTPRPPSIDLTG